MEQRLRRERTSDGTQPPGTGDRRLAELERLQQALAEAEERARSHWEQYLRAVAELDNVRKRAQRDMETRQSVWPGEVRRRAAAGAGQPGAGRAERRAAEAMRAACRQGQEATLKLLAKALERLGVTPDQSRRGALRPGTA